MKVEWSFHARDQRAAILRKIAQEQSRACASRWNAKFRDTVNHLVDFPESGFPIPDECFATVPDHKERLRVVLCVPYRIVYELQAEQISILAIMHSRMLVWTTDTSWH